VSPKQLQAAPWGAAAQENPKPMATQPGDTGLTHPGDVGLLGVVLGWHQQEQDAVKELDAKEGGDAHVEEDAEEHGQRDVLQDGLHEDGDACGGEGEARESCWGHPTLPAWGRGACPQLTDEHGHQQATDALFLDLQDLGLLAGSTGLAHDGEGVGVGDGADGGGSEPGHAEEGGHPPHGHDQQQVQVEAGALQQLPLGLADDEAAGDSRGRVTGGRSPSTLAMPGTTIPHPQSSRGDLRLEEDEDEDQEGGHCRGEHHPDGEAVVLPHGVDKPAPGRRVGDLQPSGDIQFLDGSGDGGVRGWGTGMSTPIHVPLLATPPSPQPCPPAAPGPACTCP